MEKINSQPPQNRNSIKKEANATQRLVVYMTDDQYNKLVNNLNEYNSDTGIHLDMSKYVRMLLNKVLV